jgi:phosphate transport system protein
VSRAFVRKERYGQNLARLQRQNGRGVNGREILCAGSQLATRCSLARISIIVMSTLSDPEMRKGFHEQLDDLRVEVIRLGALTTEQVSSATQALLDGDLHVAESTIRHDDAVDDLTHTIEDQSFSLLARQQPMASDLRTILATLRIAHELERSADLSVNIAKTTRRLYPAELHPKVRGIVDQMGRQAANQTRLALDAYADADPTWARALADMDDAMDELTKSLFRHVLSLAPADEATVQQAVQIALVGRHFERIADHAVTIAERVVFMATGEYPVHESDRPEVAGEVG